MHRSRRAFGVGAAHNRSINRTASGSRLSPTLVAIATPLPVNDVLTRLAELHDVPVQLEGILAAHDEGYEVQHYPKLERQSEYVEGDTSYQSGIWLAFGDGSIRPNERALSRWNGKRVRISGVIRSLSSLPSLEWAGKGGFGPWGRWPAEIETYSIQRVTAEERRQYGV